jgi:YHS domain-containing protein
MFSIKSLLKSLSLVTVIFFSHLTFAADIDMNTDSNDVALHGYDTVAYFTQRKTVKGSDKYTATYKNAIYQFSNAVNRELFRGNPAKYAPQFGGYCGMGVTMKKTRC